MKLATYRDGRLAVVSRDLLRAVFADDIVPSLQAALATWDTAQPRLLQRFDALQAGRVDGAINFDPAAVGAPLPQAPQWLDGSAFENHGRLMEKAFNLPPADYVQNPMVYQGNADDFIGPTDDIVMPSEADGIDLEGELGVVTDDVPLGCTVEQALGHVKLFVLINDVSLRAHAPREMKTGFGWIQAKPCTAFGPVAVTPDELGDAWRGGRVALCLRCERNGALLGEPNGREMSFGFDRLISYVTYSRRLRAGTVIGSGTFSNADRAAGSACITERRAIEMIDLGEPRTHFLAFGERVRLDMRDAEGRSVFGAIDQRIMPARGRIQAAVISVPA